jgi:hypothetical protein
MPKGTIKRLIADRGFGLSEQSKDKTFSSTATSFKGWTIVPLERGKRWNLRLRLKRDAMVVFRRSVLGLSSPKAGID